MASAATPQPDVNDHSTELMNSVDDVNDTTAALGSLTPSDVDAFRRLGIPPQLLVEARIQRVTNDEARHTYGIQGSVTQDMSGIVFPYFDPATNRRVTARVRRDKPEVEHGKLKNKYISAYGDRKHFYFPPGAESKLQNASTPIMLVEAEKSSLALVAWAERRGMNLLAIGMGGCWGWRGRIGKVEDPHGERVDEMGPVPDLDFCNGRNVYVVLDTNVSNNPKVQQAQRALVRELERRNCEVLLCTLPTVNGVNGPDDYVATCGDEAMAKVLDGAHPAVASYEYASGRFELNDKGVYYIEGIAEDENPTTPLWICPPLSVEAKTRSQENRNWGRLLTWRDDDGVLHQWAMPAELLKGDGTDVVGELLQQGLNISPSRKARNLLTAYVQVWPVDARARCLDRLGWHGPVYVLPDKAIGDAGEHVVFQNTHAIEPAFSVAGTAEEWRHHVASPAQGNSRMVFAICTAFAGALLEPAGEDSGGFHVRGPSSTGKTTVLKLAGSAWGDPQKYGRQWRATANGLEGLAALHNDCLLILDELGQMEAREAGEAAYLLANGRGKARASRTGTARQSATWRLLFLSAGEESLSGLMARAGKKPTAGQEIRLAEIEADAGAGMGAFEELHGHSDSGALALALRDAASTYYGAVGLEWLRILAKDRPKLRNFIAGGLRQFVDEYVPKGASGQVERVARRYGLVAIAGEMATHYGLTGWPGDEATKAVGKCFVSWLTGFGGAGNQEQRALLTQVRTFFESHGASRFEDVSSEGQRIINRAGFYRVCAGDSTREYLVLPGVFRQEVCAGFDPKFATRVLTEQGWILPASDGKATQKPRLPGIGPTRVYVLGAKMWEGNE